MPPGRGELPAAENCRALGLVIKAEATAHFDDVRSVCARQIVLKLSYRPGRENRVYPFGRTEVCHARNHD